MEIIKISEKIEIHVQNSKYKKDYIDIRKYVKTKAYTGYTKQGITIRRDFLPILITSLQKLKGDLNE